MRHGGRKSELEQEDGSATAVPSQQRDIRSLCVSSGGRPGTSRRISIDFAYTRGMGTDICRTVAVAPVSSA